MLAATGLFFIFLKLPSVQMMISPGKGRFMVLTEYSTSSSAGQKLMRTTIGMTCCVNRDSSMTLSSTKNSVSGLYRRFTQQSSKLVDSISNFHALPSRNKSFIFDRTEKDASISLLIVHLTPSIEILSLHEGLWRTGVCLGPPKWLRALPTLPYPKSLFMCGIDVTANLEHIVQLLMQPGYQALLVLGLEVLHQLGEEWYNQQKAICNDWTTPVLNFGFVRVEDAEFRHDQLDMVLPLCVSLQVSQSRSYEITAQDNV
ncbi:hypothetical protein BDV96DRAFT_606797 [Lophiotrema nucula]|uniref:Uncharacterized protein n=1 Tax=Lophiotrema nucula TaxID=690887 RepID=A0A6A5YKI8_9PLEO|nr:hypothetical protein BDV96DRAFT_606797 [Lophiotrema nucula]